MGANITTFHKYVDTQMPMHKDELGMYTDNVYKFYHHSVGEIKFGKFSFSVILLQQIKTKQKNLSEISKSLGQKFQAAVSRCRRHTLRE